MVKNTSRALLTMPAAANSRAEPRTIPSHAASSGAKRRWSSRQAHAAASKMASIISTQAAKAHITCSQATRGKKSGR